METNSQRVSLLEALIEESHLLHQELGEALDGHQHDGSARGKLTTVFLSLSQQHALAFRCLMAGRLTHSAIPLMRLQFEATVKGFWVNYSASGEWIGRAGTVELKNSRPVEPPNKSIADMLKALQRTAHPLVGVQLKEFEENNLRPLNSFIHSGISALSTLHCGLPESFCCQLVRISNGLAGLGATLMAEMSGTVEAIHAVLAAQAAHLNCMPAIRAAGAVEF
jgi:hypothetical protein